VLSVRESAISPLPVRPAGPIALRPGGWQCWMCGQMGRADPPTTVYFRCDDCDVRWYGGTRHLRHGNPAFRRRELSWWAAGGLTRAPYVDHAAEHAPSPA
jgi:hypothetical protein